MSMHPLDELSPYEQDVRDQPDALRKQAATGLPPALSDVELSGYSRIILTGMGSSHAAAIPLWRALVRHGLPAWWISTTQLMDSPELVNPTTLLIMTSQSGRSGEIVAALAGGLPPAKLLIGVTNGPDNPLSLTAHICIALSSGPEATVSSKSYLNTLAAHRRLGAALLGLDGGRADAEIVQAAADLDRFDCADTPQVVAQRAVQSATPRVALVGKGDDAATALLGGLVLKEAAKVSAEGFIGGQFRHGPMEIAGPGLTAVLISALAADAPMDASLHALAQDLAAAGSQILVIGSRGLPGHSHIPLPATSDFGRRVLATNAVQALSVELAKAKGIVAGAFLFGQKITSTL